MIAVRYRHIFLLILIFAVAASFQAASQSAYLEQGTNGTGLTMDSFWDSGNFDSIGLCAGFSIAGVLDLGMGVNLAVSEMGNSSAREVNGYIFYNVFVLKQNREMPLSVQITSSYGLTTVSSEYLEDRDLVKRGNGYTIGASLLRDFMFLPAFGMRIGLFGSYRSYTVTTDNDGPTPVVTDPEWPRTDMDQDLYYGFVFSLLFKPFAGPIMTATFKGMLDPHLNFRFGPSFSVTAPIDSS